MIQKNNLFATYKTQKELHEYFQSHTGKGETFLLTLGAALMWNTIAHLIEQEQDETYKKLKKQYNWDDN